MTKPHETHEVIRTLQVMAMVCPECDASIAEALMVLDGVTKVVADWRKNLLTVTYDLRKVRIKDVETLLAEIGYPPHPGFFQRKKRQWYHFTERNELDNLKHEGACCSKPPIVA